MSIYQIHEPFNTWIDLIKLFTIAIVFSTLFSSCGKKKSGEEGFHREARAAIDFDGFQSITSYAPLKYELTWKSPETHLGDVTYKIYLQETDSKIEMADVQELPTAEERPVKRFSSEGASLNLGEWKLIAEIEKLTSYRHEEKLPLDKAYLFKITAIDTDKIEDENSILGFLGQDPVLKTSFKGCLTAETVSESEIKISFEFPNGMDSMQIYNGGQAIATILSGEEQREYNETGLAEGQEFEYSCVMKRRGITKTGTNVITAETLSSPPTPGNDGKIDFEILDTRTIDVQWTTASDTGTSQDLLIYQVYRSEIKSDLDTVEKTLLHGQSVGTLLQNSVSMVAKSLDPSTTYYFTVLVTDKAANSAVYEASEVTTPGDVVSPIPGNSGLVTIDDLGDSYVTLSWDRATDDVTKQILLTYQLFYSTSPIVTKADLESATSAGDADVDLTSYTIANLNTQTEYYYGVLVKDLSGNSAMYDINNSTTKLDFTPPVPGNNGDLAYADATHEGAVLTWSEGTDNATAQANLSYQLYYSTDPNKVADIVSTLADATPYGGPLNAIGSVLLVGLTDETTFYVNVVITDSDVNQSVYSVQSFTTLQRPSPKVRFTMASSSVNEGDGNASVEVSLTYDYYEEITVDFTVGGNADALDYTLVGATITFSPGQTAKIITIPINDDTSDEENESIVLTLENATKAVLGTPNPHILTITDNDTMPDVSFSLGTSSVSEGGTSTDIDVILATPSEKTVTVNYRYISGAATIGDDFTFSVGTLTFAPLEMTKSITIPMVDDLISEPSENAIFGIESPVNAKLASPMAHALTITDDDSAPEVSFEIATADHGEADGTFEVFVILSHASAGLISVDYQIAGTATGPGAGQDHNAVNGSMTFNAGEVKRSIPIIISDDVTDENDESIILTLMNPNGGGLGSPIVHTANIIDDDGAPQLEFEVVTSNELEDAGAISINVQLSAASAKDITFDYLIAGTATHPPAGDADHDLTVLTKTILAGAVTSSIDLTITEDLSDELIETLILTVQNPFEAVIGSKATHTLSIIDNDGPPTAEFDQINSTVDESAGTVNLGLNLTFASSNTITIHYTVGGTAENSGGAADHTLVDGDVIIPAGSTTAIIAIPINDDSTDEALETAIITLDSFTNAVSGAKNQHTMSITDNDGAPQLQFVQAASTVSENISTGQIALSLSAASGQTVTAGYTISGSALFPDDHNVTDGIITLLPGETSAVIDYTIENDIINENDEDITLTLHSLVEADVGTNSSHILTIQDDDAFSVIQFDEATSLADESSGLVTINLGLDKVSAVPITVDFTVAGTATFPTDTDQDHDLADGSITFNPGETTKIININIVDDVITELTETITISLTNPASATVGSPAVHTISLSDNDGLPVVNFEVVNLANAEGILAGEAVFVMDRTSSTSVSVNYLISGTSTPVDDHNAAAGTVVFSPGEDRKVVAFAVVDDALVEPLETLIYTIDTVTGGTKGVKDVLQVDISDNDGLPAVQFNTIVSDFNEDVGTVTIQVDLDKESTSDVTVNYSVGGSAVVPPDAEQDHELQSGSFIILAGNTSYNLDFLVVDDIRDEIDETIVVTINSAVNGSVGAQTQHTVTIHDDDGSPFIQFNSATSNANESDGSIDVEVTMLTMSSGTVTIDYAVTGTATFGDDHSRAAGTVTFLAGELSQLINIPLLNDTLDEDNETIVLTISNPTGGQVGATTVHTVTLVDDDDPPTVKFQNPTSSFTEDQGAVGYNVVLSAPSTKTVTVAYAITGTSIGPPDSPKDHDIEGGTLSFAAGVTELTISGTITDDPYFEDTETLILTLSAPAFADLGAVIIHNSSIVDNDPAPTVSFSTASSTEGENADQVTMTIDLDVVSGKDLDIVYVLAGTSTTGSDHNLADGTITIPAGSSSKNIGLQITDDLQDEPDETLIVTMISADGAIIDLTKDNHTKTIIDNDAAPTIEFSTAAIGVNEDQGAMNIEVALSVASGRDISVVYSVSGTTLMPPDPSQDHDLADGVLYIPKGSATGNITLTVSDDTNNEPSETVILDLSAPTNSTLGIQTDHTVTIADNDTQPSVAFDIVNSNYDESIGTIQIPLTLSVASGTDITINYTVTGSSVNPDDHLLSGSTVTFLAGQTSKNVSVTLVDDVLDESSENIILTLDTPVNTLIGTNSVHTLTINDNDSPAQIEFNLAANEASESILSNDVTLNLSKVSGLDITVDFTISGTAAFSADHTLADGQLTISAGSTSGTITIPVIDDVLDEGSETVQINISNPLNGILGSQQSHIFTIQDNDGVPEVYFTIDSAVNNEPESAAGLTAVLMLSQASGVQVSVPYLVSGTATTLPSAGNDHTLQSDTIVFAIGETQKIIPITLVDDIIEEPDETIIITLQPATNANLGSTIVHNITILDDDSAPQISFDNPSSSTNEPDGTVSFDVSLDKPSGSVVTVNYAATGTATITDDYTFSSGTLTFNPGETTQVVTVTVINDVSDEPNETVILDLTSIVNATAGSNTTHTLTIVDEDGPAEVAFSSQDTNGSESSAAVTVDVILSKASGQTITVDYTVAGSATDSSTDHDATGGTVTFAPGVTFQQIGFGVIDDAIDEPSETVVFALTNPANSIIGTNSAHTYTITDDDGTPNITFDLAASNINESGGTLAIGLTLSGEASENVTVNYTVSGNANKIGPNQDHTLADGTITFIAGATTATLDLPVLEDILNENNETVFIELAGPVNAILGSIVAHTATIDDNDSVPEVGFNPTTVIHSEVDGIVTATLELSAASQVSVEIDYTVSGNTTMPGQSNPDHDLDNGTIIFAAGEVSKNISITLIDDTIFEPSESLILTLSNPVASTIAVGAGVHTMTVNDDDGEPVVEFTLATNNNDESASSDDIEVSLSTISAFAVTVDYIITGTAANPADHDLAGGSITISAGDTTGLIPINIIEDLVDEADETVILTLSNPVLSTIGSNVTHTFTINDNDGSPEVNFDIAANSEDENVGNATALVNLDKASEQEITVNYAVSGSATAVDDHTAVNGTLTFAIGETTKTITMPIVDDSLTEASETVRLTLSTPVNVTIGATDEHLLTITDNDNPPEVTYELALSASSEGTASEQIKVLLDHASTNTITVDYGVAGTTVNPDDHSLSAGTLTFNPGEVEKLIQINIVDDSMDEDDETVIFSLSNVNAFGVIGSQNSHTLTIADNDGAPDVEFALVSINHDEFTSAASVEVRISAASSKTIGVDYTLTGDTVILPLSDPDHTLQNGSITFDPGETSKTLVFTVNDDIVDEVDENLIITLSNPTESNLGTIDTHTFVIKDDDGSPTIDFSLAGSSYLEDGGAQQIALELNAPSATSLTVDFLLTGSTATEGLDANISSSTVTFAPGEVIQYINVDILDDLVAAEGDETFNFQLTNPVNVILGLDTHIFTIQDNDFDPEANFLIPISSFSEGAGTVQVEVILDHSSSNPVTITYAVSGVGAADHDLVNGTVVVAAGDVSKMIDIAITPDNLTEPDEDLVITLYGVPVGGTLGTDIVHTLTILDDDGPPVIEFTTAIENVSESVGTKNVEVTLSHPSTFAITVAYAVSGTSTKPIDALQDHDLVNGSLNFPANTTSVLIPIAITPDSSDEDDESIIIMLSAPTNASLGPTNPYTLIIQDDDGPPEIRWTLSGDSQTESAGLVTVDMQISAPSSYDVFADFTVGGTATKLGNAGADHDLIPTSIQFSPGQTTKSVTFNITGDTLPEDSETVTMQITNPINGTLTSPSLHTFTIIDDDVIPEAAFTTSLATKSEADGTYIMTVQLNKESGQTITVGYNVTGSSDRPSDHDLLAGLLTFNPGDLEKTISVTFVNDAIHEPIENLILTLQNPSNVTLGAITTHTITINDDDTQPDVLFTTNTSGVSESIGNHTIQLYLTEESGYSISVPYLMAGTASNPPTSNPDVDNVDDVIVFLPGDTVKTISLSVNEDLSDEFDETVIFTLDSPTNANLGGTVTHTTTIYDNDDPPLINFQMVSQSVSETVGTVNIKATLTAESARGISAEYTVGGTAIKPVDPFQDHDVFDGTLVFNPGDVEKLIVMTINDDSIPELDETVVYSITNTVNATIGATNVHTLTINDNEAMPNVAFALATSDWDEEVNNVVVLTVGIAEVTGSTVSVQYSVSGTATEPPDTFQDHTLYDGSIVFEAGQQQKTISFNIIDDALFEGSENIAITLFNPVGLTLSTPSTHTVSVTDTDIAPTISFHTTASTTLESSGFTPVKVILSDFTVSDIDVDYQFLNGTVTHPSDPAEDHSGASGTLTIPAGATFADILVPIVNDSTDEENENFEIMLTNPVGAILGVQTVHLVEITDDDVAPTIEFSQVVSSVVEGTPQLSVFLELTESSERIITVDYVVSGTATAAPDVNQDHKLESGTFTFMPGETSGSLDIIVEDDASQEGTEYITLDIANPQNVFLGTKLSHTVTLDDNDHFPTLNWQDATVSGQENGSDVTISLELSFAAVEDVVIPYTISGTASQPADHDLVSGSVTILAGNSSADIIVALVDDGIYEGNETIIATFSNPTNANMGTAETATITILDDDTPPVVSFVADSQTVDENIGTTVSVQISLDTISPADVAIPFTVSGVAVNPNDHDLIGGLVIITAGLTNAYITFDVVDDTDWEFEFESVIISLGAPSGAVAGTFMTHEVIINDTTPPPATAITCTTGDLSTTCYIDEQINLNDGDIITGSGSLVVQGSGLIKTQKEETASIVMDGDITIEWGGKIEGNYSAISGENIEIKNGAKISANGYGFAGANTADTAGDGPGGLVGYGAAHGGQGGTKLPLANVSYGYNTNTYGSETKPLTMGSGGSDIGGYDGGDGGGAIRISANNLLTINGDITANGFDGMCNCGHNPVYAGGGAGGSVYITALDIAGNGDIFAIGGDSQSTAIVGGGGGRIAMYSQTQFGGTLNVNGGQGASSVESVGTIYTETESLCDSGNFATSCTINQRKYLGIGTPDFNITNNLIIASGGELINPTNDPININLGGDLLINGGDLNFSNASAPIDITANSINTSSGTFKATMGSLTANSFSNGGTWNSSSVDTMLISGNMTTGGTMNLSVVDLDVTGDLFVTGAWTGSIDDALITGNFNVSGAKNGNLSSMTAANITVSGIMSADGYGNAGGASLLTGSGIGGGLAGITQRTSGAGGSYGGKGSPSFTGSLATDVFGTSTVLTSLGSGGGGGFGTSGYAGGGLLNLFTVGTFTNSGTISANGASGYIDTSPEYGAGGGGSGGSISITAGPIVTSGNLSAIGGASPYTDYGRHGGSGGGGRIYIDADDIYTGSVTVAGGLGAHDSQNRFRGDPGSYHDTQFASIDDICSTGTLAGGTCEVTEKIPLQPDYSISGTGALTIKSGGKLYAHSENSFVIDIDGAVIVESGGEISSTLSTLEAASVNVNSGGAITASIDSATIIGDFNISGDVTGNILELLTDTLTLQASGIISADGKGFTGGIQNEGGTTYPSLDGEGNGGGETTTSLSRTGGGGSHGGNGGYYAYGSLEAQPYGDEFQPISFGSGGGGGGISADNVGKTVGGSGGGLIKISATNAMILDGLVSSNGVISNTARNGAPGSGAGGSIWLTGGTVSGSGSLAANGGNGRVHAATGINPDRSSGAGGGGRIALYGSGSFAGSVSVDGGANASVNTSGGGVGTYYRELGSFCKSGTSLSDTCIVDQVHYFGDDYIISGTGNLTIESGGQLAPSTAGFTISIDLDGDLTVESGGLIDIDLELLEANNISFNLGSTVTSKVQQLTAAATLDVSGNFIGNIINGNVADLSIPVGGAINADGAGFTGGIDRNTANTDLSQDATGNSAGDSSTANGYSGGGGGHAGVGGDSAGSNMGGTTIYGSITMPITFGSGGGYGNSTTGASDFTYGGNGGGAIHLAVIGTATINGGVTANGIDGSCSGSAIDSGCGAGGAGGSVWISAATLAGSGSISAAGGNGKLYSSATYKFADSGAGGGGRIALDAPERFLGSFNVAGGQSAKVGSVGDGGNGSIHLTTNEFCTSGDLGSTCNINASVEVGAAQTVTANNIVIQSGGRLVASGGMATLNLSGDLTIEDGGSLEGEFSSISVVNLDVQTNSALSAEIQLLNTSATMTVGGTISGNIHDSSITAFDLTAGGIIDVTGEGYHGGYHAAAGEAISSGSSSLFSNGVVIDAGGGGGGHGGVGGTSLAINAGGSSFGSSTNPTTVGAGGGGAAGAAGGNGGGIIKLDVTGTLNIDGSIIADGDDGDSVSLIYTGGGGGGAGGTIWLSAATISGAGSLSADGGAGGQDTYDQSHGAGGAGGRIYVDYSSHIGVALSANGGTGNENNTTTDDGQAGSLNYTMTNLCTNGADYNSACEISTAINLPSNHVIGGSGSLVIKSGASFNSFNPDLPVTINLSGGVTVESGASITVLEGTFSSLTADSFTIDTGASWSGGITTVNLQTLTVNGTLAGNFPFVQTNNATIGASGTFNADGRGYDGGYNNTLIGKGPGGAMGPDGMGGSHGGSGGDSSSAFVTTSAYGDRTAPATSGSGGTGGALSSGGAGGGIIKLVVSSVLQIDGGISSNGDNAEVIVSNYGAGGGAGGSLWIETSTITGAGSISAVGGNGGDGSLGEGGGGSGGRILFDADTHFQGAISSDGGLGGESFARYSGSAGSYYSLVPQSNFCDSPAADPCEVSKLVYISGEDYVFTKDVDIKSGGKVINLNDEASSFTSSGYLNINLGGELRGLYSNIELDSDSDIVVAGDINGDLKRTYSQNFTIEDGGSVVGNLFDTYTEANFSVGTSGSSSAMLDASGRGLKGGIAQMAGFGPGAGSVATASSGGGAGYAGLGGDGNAATTGGTSYGSANAPLALGSGGAGGVNRFGGSGGGVIKIEANGNIEVFGTIDVSGSNGQTFAGSSSLYDPGGGGSGGSALLIGAIEVRQTGSIIANGGDGGTNGNGQYGGGGSAGRIAIYKGSASTNPSTQVLGGNDAAGIRVGSAGTTVNTVQALGPNFVFVSSSALSQNGDSNANDLCQDLASTNALPGVWQALISDGSNDIASLTMTKPVNNMNGQIVANNITGLISGTITNAVKYDENGIDLGSQTVWTGSDSAGVAASDTCFDWSWSGGATSGQVGLSDQAGSTWLDNGVSACDQNNRFYCINIVR
jgi:hypothetical protein